MRFLLVDALVVDCRRRTTWFDIHPYGLETRNPGLVRYKSDAGSHRQITSLDGERARLTPRIAWSSTPVAPPCRRTEAWVAGSAEGWPFVRGGAARQSAGPVVMPRLREARCPDNFPLLITNVVHGPRRDGSGMQISCHSQVVRREDASRQGSDWQSRVRHGRTVSAASKRACSRRHWTSPSRTSAPGLRLFVTEPGGDAARAQSARYGLGCVRLLTPSRDHANLLAWLQGW
jgi:hypothetical protein